MPMQTVKLSAGLACTVAVEDAAPGISRLLDGAHGAGRRIAVVEQRIELQYELAEMFVEQIM